MSATTHDTKATLELPIVPGVEWHTDEWWQKGDLDGGYRPLLMDELPEKGDEIRFPYMGGDSAKWNEMDRGMLTARAKHDQVPQRTKRPLPGMTKEETDVVMGFARMKKICTIPVNPHRKPWFPPRKVFAPAPKPHVDPPRPIPAWIPKEGDIVTPRATTDDYAGNLPKHGEMLCVEKVECDWEELYTIVCFPMEARVMERQSRTHQKEGIPYDLAELEPMELGVAYAPTVCT